MRGERDTMHRWLPLLVAVPVMMALTTAGCGRKTVGEVNGKKISQQEYYKVLERMAVPLTQGENPVRDPTGRLIREQAGYLALRMLVDRQIVLEMAEKEKVMPTEEEINKELERQKKLPGFNERLKTLGYTQDDLKEDIKVDLAAFKLLTKGVTVSDDEVKRAYQQNIQQFTIPAQVQVGLILVDNRKTLNEVQDMLKKGQDFHVVALQKSVKLPNMPQGGGVWLRETDDTFKQFPQLWQVLQKTPIGSITPPQSIKLPSAQGKMVDGWVIFKVLDRKQRQVRPLNEVKEDLRRLLMQAKSKRPLARELMQMRAQAKVSFEIPRFNRRWQEDMKQLQQQIQQAPPAVATPTTPSVGGATP